MRRICVKLEALGDTVVPARKAHAFFRALPDSQYESLKTVLLCDRQRDGTASSFENIAARTTSYHAMQIREKATVTGGTGYGGNNAGSHERALTTVTHEGSRHFRRKYGRGQGRGRRGNGNRHGSVRENNNGGYMSTNPNRNSNRDNSYAGGTNGGRGRGRGSHSGRGGRGSGRNDGKNRHGRCNYCRNSTEHGWHDCPLHHSYQESDDTYHVNAAQVSSQRERISHAWCTITENAEFEKFQVVIGDGAERPPNKSI